MRAGDVHWLLGRSREVSRKRNFGYFRRLAHKMRRAVERDAERWRQRCIWGREPLRRARERVVPWGPFPKEVIQVRRIYAHSRH